MKKTVALGLLAISAVVQANGVVPATDPLLRGSIYVDLARAGDRVVAVGDRGHIIYSDDEGQHWRQAETPTSVLLTAVCFADAEHGWAVGHDAVVLGTRDGGTTWTLQYSDALDDGAEAPDEALDEEALSDEALYSDDLYSDDLYSDDPYADEGVAMVDTSGAPLLDVWCDSSSHAMAVGGYGYMVETRDGGDSWQRANRDLNNADGWHFYSIAPLNGEPDTLFISGEKGTLYRSRDRGETWAKLDSPYHGTFFGTVSSDVRTLLAHGLQGNVWLSRDRGDTWQKVSSGLRSGVNAGTVLSDGTLVMVGNAGAVLTSHDQGTMLSVQFVPGRQTISSVLPRKGGGVLTAGASGVRILDNIR